MFILDSSAIIELIAGSILGKKVNDAVGNNQLATTTISLVEVLTGIRGKAVVPALAFFDAVEVLAFDKKSALETVWIEKELRRNGNMIGRSDIFIAGICKRYDYMLVTCDKDFNKVKSIKRKVIS
jgi:predicted nucleic acid-binding protein